MCVRDCSCVNAAAAIAARANFFIPSLVSCVYFSPIFSVVVFIVVASHFFHTILSDSLYLDIPSTIGYLFVSLSVYVYENMNVWCILHIHTSAHTHQIRTSENSIDLSIDR